MKTVDLSKLDDAGWIALAREFVQNFSASLPKELYAGAFTLKSKIPFKATSLREVLIHRVSELATVAIDLYEQGRIVPAFVMTRAVVETVAIAYWLHQKVSSFLQTKDIRGLDEFVMKTMLGSRDGTTKRQAPNVLTAVDQVEIKFPGFRSDYDRLCEFTHPNWSGTLGAYGEIDGENYKLHLGKEYRQPPLSFGIRRLVFSLKIFQDYYNDLASKLKDMNDYFEGTIPP